MRCDRISLDLARLVPPRALSNYAQALGWKYVDNVNGRLTLYHRPDSALHQIVIPNDETLDDYGEAVVDVVLKLAEFEHRKPKEVLDHLLLPPADVLKFRDLSSDAENGTLALEHAASILDGTRRMLLSVAHSVLRPQRYHPRLGRGEAEQFVRSCRLGQTERGSFTIALACPLDYVFGTVLDDEPFARRVTQGLVSLLNMFAEAVNRHSIDELADENRFPLLSANFCEAMLMLAPRDDRAKFDVSAAFSRALPPSTTFGKDLIVRLEAECFHAAEYLAPKMRSLPQPKEEAFVGFVDVLRGQAGPAGQMAGEVVFSILYEGGEYVRARSDLSAQEYHIAGEAHLKNEPVFFVGILTRAPHNNRLSSVRGLRILTSEPANEERSRAIDIP